MATKFGMDDEAGYPYTSMQDFITIQQGVFALRSGRYPVRSAAYKVTRLVYLCVWGAGGFSSSLLFFFTIIPENSER